MNRADHWQTKFANLRIDRARGDPAPHKPLLLLALCDLAEQGALPHGALPLSPELAYRFFTYWSIVAGRRSQRPDIVIPSVRLSFRAKRGIPLRVFVVCLSFRAKRGISR